MIGPKIPNHILLQNIDRISFWDNLLISKHKFKFPITFFYERLRFNYLNDHII